MDLNKEIHKKFSKVLNWRYNNEDKDSVVITFDDGSEAVYDIDKIAKMPTKEGKKVRAMEALDETDIEKLSELSLTEEELSHVLSLLNLISDDEKDSAISLVESLFKGKKLVSDDAETAENLNNYRAKRSSISERYTRILLGDK